jgi:3-hydroxybutyryl-CoA dehydrogenase
MGAGIAQVAATAGWTVRMLDVDDAVVHKAVAEIERRLARLVEKGRMSAEEGDAAADRVRAASGVEDMAPCRIILEAVVEDLDIKVNALRSVLPVIAADAIIATNTSSLSVSRLGDALDEPARTVGTHFFNPAPLLPLVEIVRGERTDQRVVDEVTRHIAGWGKTPVHARDTPGFIVNRVARPFYLEAWRILAEGLAGADEIDEAMRTLGGFRMGPFELTDLIGQDVNTATTRSVWEQLGRPPRLAPSPLQETLVAEGHLGRKTGRGVYRHDTDPPEPAMPIEKRALAIAEPLLHAVEAFAERATDARAGDLHRYVFCRILAAIINEAAWAHHDNVASEADIDTAMKLGTSYPHGPFEWARRIGHERVVALLEAYHAAPSP